MGTTLLWFICSVAITVQPSNTLSPNVSKEFLDAIRCVESNGDVCAIGDNGDSIGAYQIQLGYYNDAVEFSSALRTSGKGYKDLWGEGSKEYSESVIRAYMGRYATRSILGRDATYEDLARIHNGGPNGWTNPNTLGYWNKVSAALTQGCQETSSHRPGMCEPKCKPGQCCTVLADAKYKCFCLQELECPAGRHAKRPCEECSTAGIDLVFVLDSSGSIGSTNFQTIRNFVNMFVRTLEIGPTRSQIGVIVFSSNVRVQFNLNTNSDRTSLMSAVNSIPYIGGGTNTAEALRLLASQGFVGARPVSEGVPRVAIVVTDGKSKNAADTARAAEALRQNKLITVYAVGIRGADTEELNAIAGTSDRVRSIDTFGADDIRRLQEDLNEQVCTASTAVEVETAQVNRSINRNTTVYLVYKVPSEGFTVKVGVGNGKISICGSRSLERPDCSYSPSYDWILEVDDYADIYINGNGIPRDGQQTVVTPTGCVNITVFVTVQGVGSNNTFMLNTTKGDTARPSVTPPPVVPPFRPNECASFIGDTPRVEGGNITINVKLSPLVRKATCILFGTETAHPVDCTTSGIAQYSLPPADTIVHNRIRVDIKTKLVNGNTCKITRRMINIGPPDLCIVNFINDGVRVFSNGTAKLEFTSSGPTSTFSCRMDYGTMQPCSNGQLYSNLRSGKHHITVFPNNCHTKKYKLAKNVFTFRI